MPQSRLETATFRYWPHNKPIPRGWKKADTALGDGRLMGAHGAWSILIQKVEK